MKKQGTGPERLRPDRKPRAVRIGLLLVFLAGAALVLTCLLFPGSSLLSSLPEGSYRTMRKLTANVKSLVAQGVDPVLADWPEEDRAALRGAAEALVRENWAGVAASGGDMAEDALKSAEDDGTVYRLLCTTWLFNGPKISAGQRKKITALDDEAAQAFRAGVLGGVLREDETLPSPADDIAEGLEGNERKGMLFQADFVSSGSTDSSVADNVSTLKKNIRNKEQQLAAFRMIAEGKVTRLQALILSNRKSLILIGIILMFDALLLALLMQADRNWTLDVKWILVLLIVDFLLYFQLLPSVYLLIRALFPDGSFSLETIRSLYTDPIHLDALKNTLIASFATMILGTLIAFPLAWLVGRTNLYGRKFFRRLFVLSYMVPPYVGAMAWMRLMNPNAGIINRFIKMLFSLPDVPGPLDIYTLPGMIWVLTCFYYPYAFITISRAMEKMDPTLEEASRISGASPLKTVLKVTLPMMTPSLLAGALLVFISAASCYGIPSIIGTQGNVNTVTTRIVEYVTKGKTGVNDAVGLSVFLMGVSLVVLFLSDVVLAKKQYITVSGKSVQPSVVHLRRWRVPLTVLVSLFAVVMILLPFGVILTTSFKTDVGKSLFAAGNFTLSNWTGVFTQGETLSCLQNSLVFASIAATIGLVIACVMSYLLQRTQIRGRGIPNFLITLGSGTPSVVIALGLIMTMRGNFGLNIYNTAAIMIVAYLIKHLMIGMRTVTSAMSQIHVSLEESSQASGASWLRTMLKITGPLIFPSIAAGWFLIFIPSFYELSMTTLLYSSTTKTIGYQLYEYWTFTSQPMSCAMAFGILLIVVFLNFLLNRLTKGEFSI